MREDHPTMGAVARAQAFSEIKSQLTTSLKSLAQAAVQAEKLGSLESAREIKLLLANQYIAMNDKGLV